VLESRGKAATAQSGRLLLQAAVYHFLPICSDAYRNRFAIYDPGSGNRSSQSHTIVYRKFPIMVRNFSQRMGFSEERILEYHHGKTA